MRMISGFLWAASFLTYRWYLFWSTRNASAGNSTTKIWPLNIFLKSRLSRAELIVYIIVRVGGELELREAERVRDGRLAHRPQYGVRNVHLCWVIRFRERC